MKAEILTYVDAAGATLFTDAQAQKFVDFINNLITTNNDYIKTRSAKLQTLADLFYATAGGGDGLTAAINAAWVAFYNKADVLAAIASGKKTLAEQLESLTATLSADVVYQVS